MANDLSGPDSCITKNVLVATCWRITRLSRVRSRVCWGPWQVSIGFINAVQMPKRPHGFCSKPLTDHCSRTSKKVLNIWMADHWTMVPPAFHNRHFPLRLITFVINLIANLVVKGIHIQAGDSSKGSILRWTLFAMTIEDNQGSGKRRISK